MASAIDELARKLVVDLPICGSRTTFATGMAVIQACEDIIAQCKQRAALTWDLDEEQVDWVDGEAVPKPGVNADVKPLSLADIATRLQAAPAPAAPVVLCWVVRA